jgi:XTP/dITP diphosphohydrolase
MKDLLVATTNLDKLREIRSAFATAATADKPLASLSIKLLTLADFPPVPVPEETADTFWENARVKAQAYARATGQLTVAEDSGLCIDALAGEPGVKSARFLGADTSYPDRFAEIWKRMAALPSPPRSARFVTALTLASPSEILFETETSVEGAIHDRAAGANGFGYDPIFFYAPFARTTAELVDDEKAAISHRARAFRNLRRFLAATA